MGGTLAWHLGEFPRSNQKRQWSLADDHPCCYSWITCGADRPSALKVIPRAWVLVARSILSRSVTLPMPPPTIWRGNLGGEFFPSLTGFLGRVRNFPGSAALSASNLHWENHSTSDNPGTESFHEIASYEYERTTDKLDAS
jgi:hypothetical protein